MDRIKLLFVLLLLGCCSCSARGGYEALRQMNYQECVRNSPHPAEDCPSAPDYDEYRRQRQERYPWLQE